MNLRRLIVFLLVFVCVTTSAVAGATLNLDSMSLAELTDLQEAVSAAIEKNHKTNSSEEEGILNAVKQEVEALFARQGIEISWAWVNYTYTKNWQSYTLTTHIDYLDSNGTKQKPEVYAEVTNTGGLYQLTHLLVGGEVVIAGQPALSSASGLLSEPKKPPLATPAPVKPLKVTASVLMKAYDNNEVKADKTYKDKLLTITGKVGSVSESWGQTIVEIGTGSAFEFGIRCYFDSSQNTSIAQLDTGDQVTITGTCDGQSFLSVTLNNCVIEP